MCFCISLCNAFAQTDSVMQLLQKVPVKYLKDTEKKISKYSKRISNKTEKTLTKLSKWEAKVQQMLQKINPEAASNLFSNEHLSFKQMLVQYKQGESVIQGYKTSYDEYTDQLNTQIKFLDSNRNFLTKSKQQLLIATKEKSTILENEERQNEALQKTIKERKRLLIAEATKYLGKNKQLQKINKEAYYYAETLKNYKQLFKDKTKREDAAKKMLSNIPGFKSFMQKNSMLASLFGISEDAGNSQSLVGLQTRLSTNSQIQGLIASGGPNAGQRIQQNMQQAEAELSKIKQRIEKAGGSGSSELPDFRPNNQKTKTFFQRLEYSVDLQPQKGNNFIPAGLNTGANLGYKLNDKSVIGLGLSYKLGLGNIQKIKLSHQGIGFRSFIDWKLKKQFFISGGYEISEVKPSEQLSVLFPTDQWQRSGLIGISKKYKIGKKRNGKTQLLWDFLSYQQIPKTQPIIFRIGIPLK